MGRKKNLPDAAVLVAAGRVFGRIGTAHFTLADVAKEAGLAPATLLQRFGSKRALTLAFAEHAARIARAPFEEARARTAQPLAALRAALVLGSQPARDRQALRHSLSFLQDDLADAELRAHAARHARWTEANIRALLEEAVANGELTPTDTGRLARALQAGWTGALIQWAIRGRGSLGAWLGGIVDSVLEPHRTAARALPLPARRRTPLAAASRRA